MSEQLKFYKGNEANLPSTFVVGAIYHCLDTGNTYIATSTTTKQLFSTSQELPGYSTSENGKFLRIVNGVPAWDMVPSAEEDAF